MDEKTTRKTLIDKALAAAGSVRGINIGDVRALQVPLPSLDEQRQIVVRVEELLRQADAIETVVETTRTRVDKLEQSILARAFRGELVPQDPNDEPASVLLDRIRAEREKYPSKRPATRIGRTRAVLAKKDGVDV